MSKQDGDPGLRGSRFQRHLGILERAWWIDVLVAAIVSVGGIWLSHAAGFMPFAYVADPQMLSLFGQLLSLATFFAGFTTVAFTTYLSMKGDVTRQLKRAKGREVLRVWLQVILLSWVASLMMWVANVGLAEPLPAIWGRWLAMGALALLVIQLGRVVALFWMMASLEHVETRPARPTAARPIGIRPNTDKQAM